MIRISVVHQKGNPEVTFQVEDNSQRPGDLSVKLPLRALEKLSAMLSRLRETKSYHGEITVKDGKVFSGENIQKEITE